MEGGVQDNAVAKYRADDEQGQSGDKRRQKPLTLTWFQRWQEKCQNLPQRDGGSCNYGGPQCHGNVHRKGIECAQDIEHHVAVAIGGHELGHGSQQELNYGTRGKIENAGCRNEANNYAHKTHAQFA